jgi:endonuclease G, mitochondrial
MFCIDPTVTKMSQLSVSALIFLAAILSASCGFVRDRVSPSEGTASDERTARPAADPETLPFGIPSDTGSKDDHLLIRDHYALSYNDSRGTANWVAWFTRREDLGERRERPLFEPDPLLPARFDQIKYSDYSGSGYDRGHLLPSADRFADERRNADTFYLTNIAPQTPALNQYPWQKLEKHARSFVYRGDVIYTIAGVYGDSGRLKNKVTVPTNFWKVIVIFPRGKVQISRSTRVIAVDMPNIEGIEGVDWKRYLTTVRRIEAATGLDLFNEVDRDIQDAIENRPDTGGKPAY